MDQDEVDMRVGFGPGNIVLDGDPAPPPKGAQPQFVYVVAKRLDGLRYDLV